MRQKRRQDKAKDFHIVFRHSLGRFSQEYYGIFSRFRIRIKSNDCVLQHFMRQVLKPRLGNKKLINQTPTAL